jgi:hypothetical protein
MLIVKLEPSCVQSTLLPDVYAVTVLLLRTNFIHTGRLVTPQEHWLDVLPLVLVRYEKFGYHAPFRLL